MLLMPPRKKQRVLETDTRATRAVSVPLVLALESLLAQLVSVPSKERIVDLPLGCSFGEAALLVMQKLAETEQAVSTFVLQSMTGGGSSIIPSASSCASTSIGASEGQDILATLPTALLSHCFSFLTIPEHFSLLPQLAWCYGRFLHRRSCWPPRLVVMESNYGTTTTVRFGHGEGPVIPADALGRLGRVGFKEVKGCGPASFSLLANPATRSMECDFLELKNDVLAPLTKMTALEELVMVNVQGETDEGLRHLRGLPLTRLELSDTVAGGYGSLKMSRGILSALVGMPLKTLQLMAETMPRDFQAFLPPGLPLEDLDLCATSSVTDVTHWGLNLSHLATYPLKRLAIPFYSGGSLAALSKLPLEYLDLTGSTLSDEDLSTLRGFRIKTLFLSRCNQLSAKAFDVLSDLPLTHLDISANEAVTDASLSTLRGLPLRKLKLGFCAQLSGEGLASLSGLPLEELDLTGSGVTDANLSVLRELPLKKLHLSACSEVTGWGLVSLSGLSLQELFLDQTFVTDASLFALRGLPLTRLDFTDCNLSGDGMVFLSGLPLQELDLACNEVDDASLSALQGLPLKRLNLQGCELTGDGLVFLSDLPLTELDLAFTDVTDASLSALRGLPLKKLNLHGCDQITRAGRALLCGIHGLQIEQ
eukprot:gb/GEZN01003651.1/.p1 GENE.gb/GEZN01003651.1/~~gb/GEZN01003651.1/.p1  ORF type:complete len:650 (+),score=71.98 gb/GEZN01003651.1/:30-1979(+)